MEEDKAVFIKVFDQEKGDVLFEGKVSTDVEPGELVWLGCFRERGFDGFYNKATNMPVMSLKGFQNNVELVAGVGRYKDFKGVLYVGAEDGVLRKSKRVPSCECVLMTALELSHEECEGAFKSEMLEELEMYFCYLLQIPKEIGKLKKLKKLALCGLEELRSIPGEIGELSSLEELQIVWCGFESLPKRLKELKMLKSISLESLHNLQLKAEDLVVLSKLRHLTIMGCSKVFTPPFRQCFWEMIKSRTDLRMLELNWESHDGEMVVGALKENGSIVDGGEYANSYAQYFERNKENHERAMECAVQLLAIRRWRNALNGVPKEMVKMMVMMVWNTRCDVEAWRKK